MARNKTVSGEMKRDKRVGEWGKKEVALLDSAA